MVCCVGLEKSLSCGSRLARCPLSACQGSKVQLDVQAVANAARTLHFPRPQRRALDTLRAMVTACTQQAEKSGKGAAPLRLMTHTRQSLAELVRLSIVCNHEGLVTRRGAGNISTDISRSCT